MARITHEQFFTIASAAIRSAKKQNLNRENIILGAVELFFEHNKNVAYLNRAMDVARATHGLRVNAVKAFLTHFTGATFKSNKFAKGGKRLEANTWVDGEGNTKDFADLSSWLDYADAATPEPEYDANKAMAQVYNILTKRAEIARDNGAIELAEKLEKDAAHYKAA